MIYIYRVYQFLIMMPLMIAVTIVTAVITIVACALGGGRWWGYYPAKIWARIFCWLTFVKVTVSGRDNITPDTAYVFVANHQGAYDIFSIYGYLNHNFRWMMKSGLRSIPLVGYACEKSQQIYVDKSSPSALKRTMSRAESLLAKGMSIIVFPEGARTFDGKVRQFKRGAFTLAQEFNLPVVPVTIDGAYSVLPRTAKLPRPGHIHLTIHKPILPGEQGHDMQQLITLSRQAIVDTLPERYR